MDSDNISSEGVESLNAFIIESNGNLTRNEVVLENDNYKEIKQYEGFWVQKSIGQILIELHDNNMTQGWTQTYSFDESGNLIFPNLRMEKLEKKEYETILKMIPILGAWQYMKINNYIIYFANGTAYEININENRQQLYEVTKGEWYFDKKNQIVHEKWGNQTFDFVTTVSNTSMQQEDSKNGRNYTLERIKDTDLIKQIKQIIHEHI